MALRALPQTLTAAVMSLAVGLAGCGFQLRGGVGLPEAYTPVHVSGPQDLRAAIETGLRGGGAAVTAEPTEAGIRLELFGESFSQRTLSVDPDSGNAQEYEVAYSVSYRVLDRAGRALVEPTALSLQRDYFFDSDAVLGTSRQVTVLHEEMRRDAAQQVLRRVNAALNAAP